MPRYRVAVFPNNAASGATIGYYGTMLGICSTRRRSYWVHVPALDDILEVSDADVLVVGRDELGPIPEAEIEWYFAERRWEVSFDSTAAKDSAELRGSYRIGKRERGTFHFLKRDQPAPTYQFTIPANSRPNLGHLRYFLPSSRLLNREFVMLALAAILDVEPADDAEDSPAIVRL